MKKFLILAAIALGVNASYASYLFWQVNSSDFSDLGLTSPVYAQVVAVPDGSVTGSALGLVNSTSGTSAEATMIAVDSGNAVVSLDTLGSSTAYSFYIELLNYNSSANTFDTVGRSESKTYAQLQQSNYIDVGDKIQTPASVWHGGSFTAVPEPTSAMLVMVGLGILALKRQKA